MDARDLNDLIVFRTIVESGSFTAAARKLDKVQSGVSQSIKNFERRLGIVLFARSTRSLRLTADGQRLFESIVPALTQIEVGLGQAKDSSEVPHGILRITTLEYPANTILLPAIAAFRKIYPQVEFDIDVSDRLTDIVKSGFDAGIRFNQHLSDDMISVPISVDLHSVVAAAPRYFEQFGRPLRLSDLATHSCLNYRTATHGSQYRWQFTENGKSIAKAVSGPVTVNDAPTMINAALHGLGLIYSFDAHITDHLTSGRLLTCLETFQTHWGPYRLFYPGKHQKTGALNALIPFLKGLR